MAEGPGPQLFAPPVLSRQAFAARSLGFAAFGLGGIGASLTLGAWGYDAVAGLAWTGLLSVVLYPFVHRLLHVLHLQAREADDD